MTDLLRLIVLAPLGYVAAIVAAALTVGLSVIGPGAGYGEFGLIVFVVVMMLYAGAASFVPALIAIAVAELFAIRSALYFMLAGGALGYATHMLAPFFGDPYLFEGRGVVFPAAGFVGGAVYWLIAGRLSGFGRNSGDDGRRRAPDGDEPA